ncbi:substrate-binding domain-containing protein [Pelagibacterium xiamenense]|uniref:substrate-binding domain-containing protein n=1 Tax=Pelagibacterium xiamenense TaxID=2901140 RepID=UPI001E613DAE|nr:substrate-binding domain-containing protein [Pelagibacterium xiamenense]MCD7059188.1 substrate-binding domain-containing protein [Pelagibacterium xiamenense]
MAPSPRRKRSAGQTPTRGITIKHLAAELGLSITTISRALNGYSDVGEATRQKIVEAARRAGYTPNRNAQRLVTQRSHTIAWVQSEHDAKFADPHFVEVLAGVLREARLSRYDIVLSGEPPEGQMAAYEHYVRDGSVDGFIVDVPRPDDPRVAFLKSAGVPFVVHGRDGVANDFGWVDIDNHGVFYNLAKLVVENGHRKFAFINGDEQYLYALIRRRAVDAAVRDLGLPPDTVLYFEGTHPMGDAGYQLTELALADPEVTAVIYSSILFALEGLSAITQAGKKPGKDMMIASMNDQLQYLNLSPLEGIATLVNSSLRAGGRALVAEVIRQCETGKTGGTMIPAFFDLADGISAETIKDDVLFA